MNGKPITGSGSFANIRIDGRLQLISAIDIARDYFKRECYVNHQEYMGFAIEKTERFVDYKTPIMCDTDLTAKEVAFLL